MKHRTIEGHKIKDVVQISESLIVINLENGKKISIEPVPTDYGYAAKFKIRESQRNNIN